MSPTLTALSLVLTIPAGLFLIASLWNRSDIPAGPVAEDELKAIVAATWVAGVGGFLGILAILS